MKTIVVLIALTCLLGLAGALSTDIGEGYSKTQLAFLEGPSTSTFEQNVQSYWGSYIANLSSNRATSTMDIWMTTFPLKFDTPLQFKATSFVANVAAPVLSAKEINSQFLLRNVNGQFNVNQVRSYPPTSGSLTVYNSTGTPSKDAKEKVLSQSIISLFGV